MCRQGTGAPAAPCGAGASWLRQQQPDTTTDIHEAASRPRRLGTAIGWPVASAPIYRHAHSFNPGGGMDFEPQGCGTLASYCPSAPGTEMPTRTGVHT